MSSQVGTWDSWGSCPTYQGVGTRLRVRLPCLQQAYSLAYVPLKLVHGLPGKAGPGWAVAHTGACPAHGAWWSPQLVRYSRDGLLQLGPLGSTAFLPDSKCLVDEGRGRSPALKKCENVARPTQRLWDFIQVRGLCWLWVGLGAGPGPAAACSLCGRGSRCHLLGK